MTTRDNGETSAAYNEFLSAYRRYFACTLEPGAKIINVVRPELPGEPLSYFDEHGRPYKENLDAALMAARLVSELPETLDALNSLVMRVRAIAAARATCAADDIPQEKFQQMWEARQAFIIAARQELDLARSISAVVQYRRSQETTSA